MRWTEEMIARQQARDTKAAKVKTCRTLAEREHLEQVALFQWAGLSVGKYPELLRMFAVPNGGFRHPSVAAKLKAEGVKAGVPDIHLPAARAGYHGLYIEMKAGKNKPSEAQIEWMTDLEDAGYACYVCYSADKAAAVIESYLNSRPMVGRTQK